MASRFEMSPGEQVNTEWRRCPGSMERRAIDSVAPLRQSSAGWMPARMGRLSACVGRRHPVTIRKASLMAGSMRPVRALRYQTGAQYSAVGMDRGQGSQRSCPRTQPEPANRLKCNTWCQAFAKLLEVRVVRERSVQRYSKVFGLGAEG